MSDGMSMSSFRGSSASLRASQWSLRGRQDLPLPTFYLKIITALPTSSIAGLRELQVTSRLGLSHLYDKCLTSTFL